MVKRNIFKLCRPSTEKLYIGILATLASMCEAGFWPPDLKSFLKVVLRYGTIDFEGDFRIHNFDFFDQVTTDIIVLNLSQRNYIKTEKKIKSHIFFISKQTLRKPQTIEHVKDSKNAK